MNPPPRSISPFASPSRVKTSAVRRDQVMGATLHTVRELGRGGFGVAILARPTTIARLGQSAPNARPGSPIAIRAAAPSTDYVVVKFTRLANLSSEDRENAVAEAAILRRLNHPAVVKCVDAWIEDSPSVEFRGYLAMAMEFCEGGDLDRLLKEHRHAKTRMPVAEVQRIVLRLLEGVDYIHRNKLIHRDIKPANVFLADSNRRVVLGDFGISKQLEYTAQKAQTWVGTVAYMPPEVLQGRPYGGSADIWSLGVSAYEMLMGDRPYPKEFNLMLSALDKVDPCGALRDAFTDQIDAHPLISTLCAMLNKDPLARPTASAAMAMMGGRVEAQPPIPPARGEAIALIPRRLSPVAVQRASPTPRGPPAANRASPLRVAESKPASPPKPTTPDNLRELRNVVLVHSRRTLASPSGAELIRCLGSTRLAAIVELTVAMFTAESEGRALDMASGVLQGVRTTESHAKCLEAVRLHYFGPQ